ncbi:Crp/Fnr family transcriptional regulator [Methylorubrum sp. SL192]|uniref:Putative Regulatory protein, Crp family n=1 Tax=Methylorubrum extorquens TaxID=408 RepID=A0A2N9AT62_METEX|nr:MULTISPECIES: Crp/Fnr family transcriptional regulator [Methylorubrum]ARO55763.1 cyclic nucleotide-binding protein [Methylorubrum zatmanii]KQQ00432.1 cyclic nucleotide-binding protein [Methylobacterium sp. Leaf121]MCY1641736.1 Crp/Fnr family transcriptional regulator [Methylorubrum sp. SL192]SOR30506.1 putative Regulatory protein, Crp family [Methylorubrum extorquens]
MDATVTLTRTNPLILRLRYGADLDAGDRALLADLSRSSRSLEPQQDIVRAGDRAAGVHLVLEGYAFRYKLIDDGQRQILGLLLPGDFCDLQSIVLGPSDHYIAALTACTVADIPQDRVDDLVFRDSRLARALWWATLVDESILREWLASMGQRSADKRIAHLFCELLLRQQLVGTAGERDCPLPLTQPMLADILGITTIHVSRILRDLRLAGLIQLKERRLHVPDVKRLQAFCDFDPTYLHLVRMPDREAAEDRTRARP